MYKNTKRLPTYVLIIAMFAGFSLKFASPIFQLVFLGIMIIALMYVIFNLKKIDEEKNKISIVISSIIFAILISLFIIGNNYGNMSNNILEIILLIAFVEFILTVSICGYRIVVKSGNDKGIRQFVIGTSMFIGAILLLILIILLT